MSASSVLGDVTQTLEELLEDEQRPASLFEVSLRSPADERVEAGMRPRINLYLFRAEENASAKNQPWLVSSADSRQHPPLALSLFYVVTPYADRLLDEHRVLGEAMRVLYDQALVTPSALRGALRDSGEELRLHLVPTHIEDLTRVWNAFNQPYRLSVVYRAEVVRIDSAIEERVVPVTEAVTDYVPLGRD
jgi:hypothetical protein